MPSASASAPGKVILLGEHAVVYGEPALSVSLSLRTRVEAQAGGTGPTTVDGKPIAPGGRTYLAQVLARTGGGPVSFRSTSEVPRASGMGSSASLCVAAAACMLSMRGALDRAEVARIAFEAEFDTQGGASPNDTSVVTAGGAVLLAPRDLSGEVDAELAWRVARGERAWFVHRLPVPELPLVMGNTGIRARTGEQIWKVKRTLDRPGGQEKVREVGRLVLDSLKALRDGDLRRLGALMDRNHALLNEMGAGHPALDRLVEASRKVPGTFGAKLTGAGGGGSMVALTEDPEGVAEAIRKAGGTPHRVTASARGVELA